MIARGVLTLLALAVLCASAGAQRGPNEDLGIGVLDELSGVTTKDGSVQFADLDIGLMVVDDSFFSAFGFAMLWGI